MQGHWAGGRAEQWREREVEKSGPQLALSHQACPFFLLQSHAGKVVLRSWYEKNKHIFPASRWEPYDPEKKWDKYTVRRPL